MSVAERPSLRVEGVSVDIAGQRIIDQVALHAEGNVVGLVGPNGSGKSTLLRTVYRMLQPVTGKVLTGLVKRIAPGAVAAAIGTPDDIASFPALG